MPTLNSHVSKNKNIASKVIDGKGILLNPDEAEIIQLDEVGAVIWDSINDKRTVSDIIDCVLETFQVNRRRASRDVPAFLKKLQDFGAIEKK